MKLPFLLCLTYLIGFNSALVGQDAPILHFRDITKEDGLPSNRTLSAYQDNYGYMWISTDEGLTKYDGYDFRTYFNDPESGIQLRGTCGFYEDTNQHLWIISSDGNLHRYNRQSDSFRHIPLPLERGWDEPNSHTIIPGPDGRLWISGYGGIQKLDTQSMTIELIPLKAIRTPAWPHEEKVRCASMLFTDSTTLWIGTRKFGLIKYDILSDSATYYRNDPEHYGVSLDDWISDMQQISESELLIVDKGNSKLFILDIHTGNIIKEVSYYYQNSEESIPPINDVERLQDDLFWLATERQGLLLIDIRMDSIISHYRNTELGQSRVGNDLSFIYQDSQEVYWLGAKILQQGSPSLYDFTDIVHDINVPSSLPSDEVYYMKPLSSDQLLISTAVGPAIYHLPTNQFEYPLNIPNPSERSFAVMKHSDQSIWISTYTAFYQLDSTIKKVINTYPRGIIVDSVQNTLRDAVDMLEDTYGNIWTADRWGRVKHIDLKKKKIRNFYAIAQDTATGQFISVLDILEDRPNNQILAASDYGLATINIDNGQTSFLSLHTNSTDFSRKVYSYLYQDSQNKLWAIIEGLPFVIDIDNQKVEAVDLLDRHNVGSIKWIVEEPRGTYWMGSATGIIQYDAISDESNLYPTNNVGGDRWHNPSPVTTLGGNIYFSGSKGISVLDPKSLHHKDSNAPPIITNLSINQKPYHRDIPAEGMSINLDYQQNDIDIRLSNFSYINKQEITYAYRIKELQNDWIDNGTDHTIELYNLNPNTYTIDIRASNSQGVWSTNMTSLQLNIAPPWWKSTWARIMGVGIFLGVITGVQRYRYQVKLKNNENIQSLRSKISNDLHDDVGSILTGIAMQSELLEISVASDKRKTAQQIAERSRMALTRMRDTVWAMDATKDSISDLKDRMLDHIDDTLTIKGIDHYYRSDIKDIEYQLKPNIRQALYLIFKESITNIAKHSDTTEVFVELNRTNNQISLSIRDQGSLKGNQHKSGLGIRSMNNRVKALMGEYTFEYKDGYQTHLTLPLN